MTVLRVGTFTPSVLMEVARRTGALAAAGLVIEEEPVPSSVAQFQALAERRLDAVVTNPDNALAYRFVERNPLSRRVDVVLTAALDRGLGLTLCLRPGLARLGDVARLRVGVDVATSGFALLAYALLERHGLDRRDYEVVALGSTPRRARALADGGCDVTILNAGNELTALAAGCTAVARAAEVGPYLGAVLCRLGTAERSDALDRLSAVLVETAAGIGTGRLRGEVVGAAQRGLGLNPVLAERHAAVFGDPVRGVVVDGLVDLASVQTLLGLRRRYLPAPELDTVPARLGELVVGLAARGLG